MNCNEMNRDELQAVIRKLETELAGYRANAKDMRDHCAPQYYGWYCPDSPTHECHYYSDGINEDGFAFVELSNGTIHIITDELYDSESESDDWCIFCGHPEERK